MLKLLPLYGICFLLAILSNYNSVYDQTEESYFYKEKVFFIILAIVAIIFAGLRTNYNDTYTYMESYDLLKSSEVFENFNYSIGSYPGFMLVQGLMKMAGFSSQSFIMFFSLISIGISLWFVRKYTDNIWLSVFLFFTMGYFGFMMAAIKQSTAMAISLIAVDRLINKKPVQYVLFILLAMTFHPFAMMFFIVPFLQFRPWTWRTFLVFIITLAITFSMQTWLGTAVDFIGMMGREYNEQQLLGQGINIFRVGVVWAPIALSFFTYRYWGQNTKKEQNIILNLAMLNAELMLISMFGNPIYFGRLATYFLMFQVLALPVILQCFERKSKFLLIGLVMILFFAYDYYGNVLSGGNFDSYFKSV
ncbi:MAG: EpsG family protein, partial [Lachnospiraceae bacterium]|nr:EpsG family protein [Lachnospiraceae bacterium]